LCSYTRKARCLLATKQLKDALEAFRCTLTALDSANLPVERKHKWQMDVQIMLTMLAKNKVLANGTQDFIYSLSLKGLARYEQFMHKV
jgi:endonuclease/exonuclease/phosphatase (EEP) superfamily protein YafD